jgi:hypothetical protein
MISNKVDDDYAEQIKERILKSIHLQTVENDEDEE